MDDKITLLQKMRKELEYKKHKLNKIQRSIRVKSHIKNKINESECIKCKLNKNNTSQSLVEFLNISQDDQSMQDSTSTISDFDCLKKESDFVISINQINCNSLIENKELNLIEDQYDSINYSNHTILKSDNLSNYESDVYKTTNCSLITATMVQKLTPIKQYNILTNLNYNNHTLESDHKIEDIVYNNYSLTDTKVDNSVDFYHKYSMFKDSKCNQNIYRLSQEINLVNNDKIKTIETNLLNNQIIEAQQNYDNSNLNDNIYNFVDDIISPNENNMCGFENIKCCNSLFAKFEEDKYYRFSLNTDTELITQIVLSQNHLIICYENSILIFLFHNDIFKLIYNWNHKTDSIQYVTLISPNSILLYIKESFNNLIFKFDIVFPFSIQFLASNKIWNSQLSPLICNPVDKLYFMVVNSFTIPHKDSYTSSNCLKNIIKDCILKINAVEYNVIHSVITKLTLNDFNELLIYNYIIDFKNILSISFLKNEPLLCLSNKECTILIWNYSLETSIYSISSLPILTTLSDHSYNIEGLFFIGITSKSWKNIQVINPNTNKHLLLFSNLSEQFVYWSADTDLKLMDNSGEIIFSKITDNENLFKINKSLLNIDKIFDVKIIEMSINIFTVIYNRNQLNIILLK